MTMTETTDLDEAIEGAKAAAYQIIAAELREAVPLSLLQPQQAVSAQIIEKLAEARLIRDGDLNRTAKVVVDILARERPENVMAAAIIATRIMNVMHRQGLLVLPQRIPENPRDRRQRESDAERQDENVYFGYTTPAHGPHPLSLVPPAVLEAARANLHKILVDDGEVSIDMASPVADTMVGVVLPLLRPDLVPDGSVDRPRLVVDAGLKPAEAAVWELICQAASAALHLIDDDCQHSMEKEEVCHMFHDLQRWLGARLFQRQLLGLDGGPDDPRSS